MNAAMVLKNVRGASFREKGFVGSFFRRSGQLRRDQKMQAGGGIDGTVAMSPMNQGTQDWFGNISQSLGNCLMSVMSALENCVGSAAAANSPSSESSEVSLFSISSSSLILPIVPSIFKSISKFGKFIWYGQMSNTAGFQGKWNCLVTGPKQFRVIQEIKIISASKFHKQLFRPIAAEAAHKASTKLWQFEDTRAIADYSGDGYRELNSALRTSSCSEEVRDRVDAVIKAMSKLPRFKGRVYRGTELPFGTDLTVGAEFHDLGFLSTSRLKKKAFSGSYLFVIKSSTGVDIVKHAVKKVEKEVLYPPGTRFLIKSVKTDSSDNRKIVEMEEMA